MLPCVVHEDEHLLVVNKPPGWNTHAPTPWTGEGIYDWLRNREPRWAPLAIIHRLDKETSGLLVFSLSARANRSLTEQFTQRKVRKRYILLADRTPAKPRLTFRSHIVRAGDRYVSRPGGAGSDLAETRFRVLAAAETAAVRLPGRDLATTRDALVVIEAEPLTGRTHQIRVHAASLGFPVLGDTLYGGAPARRVFLHAAEVTIRHPETGAETTFRATPEFEVDPAWQLRSAMIEPELTDCYRLVHGASDGFPGWYVDRLGEYVLSQSATPLDDQRRDELERLVHECGAKGAYHKTLSRQVRKIDAGEASPRHVLGQGVDGPFFARENGLSYELSFEEGYSVGLFLDQRDNRRRLLKGLVGHKFTLVSPAAAAPQFGPCLLNTFAYTGGFSVGGAKAGWQTTTLDLSRKYLEWAKTNFRRNGTDPAGHDFIYGDVFEWLRRLARKERSFDLVLLDPPTFSQSKASGVFRAERDYGRLVHAAMVVLRRGGVLFASCNAAGWSAEEFAAAVRDAARDAGREPGQEMYLPQPPDFPVSRAEPAYLKTMWLRLQR